MCILTFINVKLYDLVSYTQTIFVEFVLQLLTKFFYSVLISAKPVQVSRYIYIKKIQFLFVCL